MATYPVLIKTSTKEVLFKTSTNQVLVKQYEWTPVRIGVDPQVMLQWSDDGGYTWSSEYWKSAGKLGERFVRVNWNRLGSSRDRVFRVTVDAPVKWIFIGARADIQKGN